MDKPSAYIGIDPGSKGAICVLSPENSTQVEYLDIAMHPFDIMKAFADITDRYSVKVIMIEQVHALPKTSSRSTFNFGYNLGIIVGTFSTTGHKIDRVTPKVWQKHLKVTKSGVALKKEVAAKVKELYPTAEIHGPKGGLLDGRSDALGIAEFAFHKYKESK